MPPVSSANSSCLPAHRTANSASRFKEKKLEGFQSPARQKQKRKSPSGFYFWIEMDLESPAKPGDPKVTSQRAGWRMLIFLLMCLLPATSALTGPRLVSGESGGAVTIRCRYPRSAINSHQRKYWCRLRPSTGVCRTIVSTNHYTHLRYRGRVALADFPKRGLFVVRLSQLTPEDEGRYRCGLGSSNNALFLSMNLTVSPGLSRTIPTATLAYGELITGSFEIASPPAAKRCTRGNTQTTGRQRTGWDTAALTPGSRKTMASATGGQTPGAAAVLAPGTGSQAEGSVWATVPTVQSPASTIRGMTGATERGLVWSTSNSEATRATASERERETTPGTDRPSEETESISTTPGTTETAAGSVRPSTLASERWMWEPLQEETSASEPQSLGSVEGTIPAAAVWTSEPTRIEMASAEGSGDGDLGTPARDGGPHVMPSQALAVGPLGPPARESSVKSASLEEKNFCGILTPVSSVLCPLMLVTLVLWKRKLQRKKSSQKTGRSSGVTLIQMTQSPELGLQPGQPPQVGRKRLQVDPPPLHTSLSLPARDPGPQGMEG